ncbi:hypothetical protein ACES2I_02955 [Bdellovibrio bacteriovorus]|uniref:hypothetical protein n=1 Tax=Bdellovibrio bacteriovorus TaxID=959 RepID=UPI0035A6EC2F
MKSILPAHLFQNVPIPVWIIVSAGILKLALPSPTDQYGPMLISIAILFYFLRTEEVSPTLAKVNWALRLILSGLWVFGLAWSLYVGK